MDRLIVGIREPVESVAAILDPSPRRRSTVGVWDVPVALIAPRRVFARVEDVGAYGWALVWLLTAVSLLGWALVQTGLIDREVDRGVQAKIAEIENTQADVVERSALSKMIEDAKQEGEFDRLMTRVAVVGASPLTTLAIVLLIPAAFYGLVALTGRKPEWHTLVTICVFASFADVVGQFTRLALMVHYGTLDVSTSPAGLAQMGDAASKLQGAAALALPAMLSALDPFRVWFWLIMGVGLTTTMQLRGWKAWAACFGFWLIAALARTGLAVSAAAGPPSA